MERRDQIKLAAPALPRLWISHTHDKLYFIYLKQAFLEQSTIIILEIIGPAYTEGTTGVCMLSRILVTHTDYEFKDTTEDFMLVHSQLLKPAPLRKTR